MEKVAGRRVDSPGFHAWAAGYLEGVIEGILAREQEAPTPNAPVPEPRTSTPLNNAGERGKAPGGDGKVDELNQASPDATITTKPAVPTTPDRSDNAGLITPRDASEDATAGVNVHSARQTDCRCPGCGKTFVNLQTLSSHRVKECPERERTTTKGPYGFTRVMKCVLGANPAWALENYEVIAKHYRRMQELAKARNDHRETGVIDT